MNPVDRAVRSAFTEAFANYTARADINEKKSLMLDYIIKRGMLTGRQIAEAREFARLKDDDSEDELRDLMEAEPNA